MTSDAKAIELELEIGYYLIFLGQINLLCTFWQQL